MSFKSIIRARAKKATAPKRLGAIHIADILKSPVMTEKSMKMAEWHSISEKKTYSFYVDKAANKNDVALAVTKMYGVEVESIRIVNMIAKGRMQRKVVRAAFKKAYITLPKGKAIEIVS
jgi:large subunit ribosomal protein L23